jgi:TRAP-type C4-dicarboxylate transport system substrate-binding protein
MATLAPAGSTWAKRMNRQAKEIADKTGGRVKLRYFFGGEQGDERDVVRKMKLGQLQGAAMSAVGLGLIKSDVRVLELPLMFKTYEEIDAVRSKLAPEFEKMIEDAGYELLAWGDVGWSHIYSTVPLSGMSDLKNAKIWAWSDDPIMRGLVSRLGINGVPLQVPEVMGGLQTGTVDSCYAPPLAALALQWHTKIKYASATPLAYAIGAVLVRKDAWAQLQPEDQKAFLEVLEKGRVENLELVRRDYDRAKNAMSKYGVQFVPMSPTLSGELDKAAKKVWTDLIGKVYSKDIYDRVVTQLAEMRSGKRASQ